MSIKTKICGIKTPEAIKAAIEYGAAYLGFVFFHESSRYVTPAKAASLSSNLPDTIKTVGVFVDSTDAELDSVFKIFKPDIIQCHGQESEERIYDLRVKYKIPVMKAIAVRTSDDVARGKSYVNTADMLLFDAKVPSSPIPGGNGIAFDWALLAGRDFPKPWFLSGGLNIDNVKEAIKISGAQAVDVSSSLESEPGVKDPELIKLFLKTVQSL